MKTILFIPLLAVALIGCDNKEEKARNAELERRADNLENAADATEKNAKNSANAVKKEGEAKADALENAAEQTREQKH